MRFEIGHRRRLGGTRELVERPCVQHVRGSSQARRGPRLPSEARRRPHRDRARFERRWGAAIPGPASHGIAEIEPVHLAVDFQCARRVAPRRRRGFDVQLIRLALQDPPARRMADDSTFGLSIARSSRSVICRRFMIEGRVHRGHDQIEGGEAVSRRDPGCRQADVASMPASSRTPWVPSSLRTRAACSSARRSSRPLAIASAWL